MQRNSNYFLYHHYFSETAQVKHEQRRQACHRHSLLKKDQFFFQLLTKKAKRQFNATSIDQGRLAIKNFDSPQKLSRQ
ncbi:hypothetical protein [Limosilactobacillus vaginalis]|uniref:hypothetical protein n=1 Tax=Limosilactobacillus vaginalis TaxID=1633 RepID=UPI00241C020F|nr:hypothetical protein [Limosilactobacillus vaginalis]